MTAQKKDSRLAPRLFSVGQWLWRQFTSIKLALSLILILAGLSLIGALLIQVPPKTASDPLEFASWLKSVAQSKVGSWVSLLAPLGLFDVFHSLWFLSAGALLMVNIAVCILSRWQALLRATARSLVRQPEDFYLSGGSHALLAQMLTYKETTFYLPTILKKAHYRVREEESNEGFYLAADKNRFSRFGTCVSHLSIIILVLGFILGSHFGFRDTSFIVPEGEIRDVGYDTGLSLSLTSFADEYWAEGIPKDYRSYVVLYEDGKKVKEDIIRVNYPMSYRGVRFYQSFFGPSALMQVLSSDGKVLFNGGIPLSRLTESMGFQRPLGSFNLSQAGITAYLVGSAYNMKDPVIPAGELALEIYEDGSMVPITMANLEQGKPKNTAGLEFTFIKQEKYSGFQVSHDPGTPLVWLASGLFLMGTGMVFFFPHRQLWARSELTSNGDIRLLLRLLATPSVGGTSEFQGIISELEKITAVNKSSKER